MAKQSSNKENLITLINIFPSSTTSKKDFTTNEISKKTGLSNNDVYQEINNNQDVFFWITSKRVTLSIFVLKAVREAFEINHFTNVDFEVECMNTLRNTFGTRALNSNGLKKFLQVGTAKSIEYKSFVDIERKYIKIYNLLASEDKQIVEEDIYLNTYPDRSKMNYKRELAFILAENKRASQMLFERFKGKTLGEIGEKDGISRERVRKLIEKPLILARQWVYKYETVLMTNYINDDGTLSNSKALKDFPEEQWTLIKGIINNNSDTLRMLRYEPSLDVIYKDIYNIDNVISSIKFDESENILQYQTNVVKELNEKGYKFVTEDNINKFLASRHIMLPSGFFSDKRITLTAALPQIIAKYYPNGIKVSDEESLKNVANILKEKYGLVLPGTDVVRNISSKIQCTCNLIDRGTYSVNPFPKMSKELISSIHKYIIENNTRNIYFSDIFNKFEEDLKKCGIDNLYALHGAFKKVPEFSNMSTAKDYIIASSEERQTIETLLSEINDYIHSSEEPVPISELKEEFPNVKNKILIILTINYPQIIKWDSESYCDVSSLPINESIKNIFRDVLSSLTNNKYKYTGEYALYAEMLKSHSDILDLLNIDQPQQLFGIISWYLKDDYYFSTPHILKDYKGERFTADDLTAMCLAEESGPVVNKKKLIAKMSAICGRVSSTLLLSINKAFSKYIRVSQEEYINLEKMKPNNKIKKALNEILKNNQKNGITVLEKIEDVSSLVAIDSRITVWSIPDLVTYFNLPYKVIAPSPTAISPQAIFYDVNTNFANKKEALAAYNNEN